MPLLSSSLLILTHTFTTLTTSYILLTQPALLTQNSALWLLGESMHLRAPPPSLAIPSEPLAVIALLLASSALAQLFFASGLTPLSKTAAKDAAGAGTLAEQAAVLRHAQSTWMGLAGTRVLVSGVLAMWIYLVHSERGQIIDTDSIGSVKGLGLLANSVVFTVALCEMFFWGYLWTTIKEEGNELAQSVQASREQRQAVLNQDGTVSWEAKTS